MAKMVFLQDKSLLLRRLQVLWIYIGLLPPTDSACYSVLSFSHAGPQHRNQIFLLSRYPSLNAPSLLRRSQTPFWSRPAGCNGHTLFILTITPFISPLEVFPRYQQDTAMASNQLNLLLLEAHKSICGSGTVSSFNPRRIHCGQLTFYNYCCFPGSHSFDSCINIFTKHKF